MLLHLTLLRVQARLVAFPELVTVAFEFGLEGFQAFLDLAVDFGFHAGGDVFQDRLAHREEQQRHQQRQAEEDRGQGADDGDDHVQRAHQAALALVQFGGHAFADAEFDGVRVGAPVEFGTQAFDFGFESLDAVGSRVRWLGEKTGRGEQDQQVAGEVRNAHRDMKVPVERGGKLKFRG